MVQEISDKNFKEEVLKSDLPALVDFWAPWCAPCRSIAPIIEEIAEEYNGRLKVCRLNVDDNPLTPSEFKIMSIPTLMLFKGGEIAERIIGALPKSELKEKIESCLE